MQADQVPAPEAHATRLRPQIAGNQIEKRGLAGAVGADDAHELACVDGHVLAFGRRDHAEVHGQVFDFEDRRHPRTSWPWRGRWARSTRVHKPPGRKKMMTSMISPSTSCQV
jgi:hypothetical protein